MTNGEGEPPKPEKGKRAKGKGKAKRRGIKKRVRSSERNQNAASPPIPTRVRARDPDKRPPELPSLDDLQRTVRIEVLLERLAEKGEEITVAARACKIDRKTLWRWRKDIPTLDEDLLEAYRVGTESLCDEARRRGVEGVDEPVFQGGVEVGKKRVYSDGLLLALLRKRDPGGFRDPKFDKPVTPPRDAGEISINLDRIRDPALMAALEAEARRQAKELEAAR